MPPQPPPSRFLTPFYSSRLPGSDECRLSVLRSLFTCTVHASVLLTLQFCCSCDLVHML
ncbi:hypothetical protein HN51_040366, partial [Arachis hypogaea]